MSVFTKRQIKWYGWHPDLPDFRDKRYKAVPLNKPLPSVQINSQWMPEAFFQEELGACTSNAISGAIKYNLQKQNAKEIFTPSRLFIYYNERMLEGTVLVDSGAQIRDGIKSVARWGACDEKLWPYDIRDFKKKPSFRCYVEAKQHQAIEYTRLNQNLLELKNVIASDFVFVFGFSVYQGFEGDEAAKNGVLSYPKPGESSLGGHCCFCFGFDDNYEFPDGNKGAFYVRNSWGDSWGKHGNFLMPYSYMLNEDLAADFWTIKMMET
jgi:C1A family cysteine protease